MIAVHDYGGHPFPIQLSRELAKRGHEVTHLYAGYNTSPKGPLSLSSDDPERLCIKGIFTRKPLQKYSLLKRRFQEVEYGYLLRDEIARIRPEVVISAATPLDSQSALLEKCKQLEIKFIYWLQDLVGIATHRILKRKFPLIGHLVGMHYIHLGRRLLRDSDNIVLITEDHRKLMDEWGIDNGKLRLIPNWAPLEYLPVKPKRNLWARAHGLDDKFNIMYTGTLGFKHNPDLLLDLAIKMRENSQVRIVVVSEGPGSQWLSERSRMNGLENLKILPYQDFDQMPYVLASADILVAILQPAAGEYSVPSKVLSYLCAERPLVLAVPSHNLAARIVDENRAGIVVDPTDANAFIKVISALVDNSRLREEFAGNALAYARNTFDIGIIGDAFEEVLLS